MQRKHADHRFLKTIGLVACFLSVSFAGTSSAQSLKCGQPPYAAPPEVAALVSAMAPVLAEFTVFEDLLMHAGLEICLADTLIEAQGYYEPDSGRIVINARAPLDLQQAILVHELRHVQQHRTNACPAPDLSMRENARAVFAMEADASAISLVVARAMKDAGYPDMWTALSAWPLQGDIAKAFATEMDRGDDIVAATQAAFTQWYDKKPRVDLYYYATCANYLDVEDSEHRLRTYEVLDTAFFDALCNLPNGTAYMCNEPR